MNDERCDGCRFWNVTDLEVSFDLDAGGEAALGRCRRYPPVLIRVIPGDMIPDGSEWNAPLTIDSDWCGEFQPAKVESHKTLIGNLGFSLRTMNCLTAEGFACIEDVLAKPDSYLMKIPNFCRKSLHEIRDWEKLNQPANKSTT